MRWPQAVRMIIGAALVLVVVLGCEHESTVESDECQAEIAEWQQALQEANATIERLNASIEDAQGSAGSSYAEMNDALENLETGETVDEP